MALTTGKEGGGKGIPAGRRGETARPSGLLFVMHYGMEIICPPGVRAATSAGLPDA